MHQNVVQNSPNISEGEIYSSSNQIQKLKEMELIRESYSSRNTQAKNEGVNLCAKALSFINSGEFTLDMFGFAWGKALYEWRRESLSFEMLTKTNEMLCINASGAT